MAILAPLLLLSASTSGGRTVAPVSLLNIPSCVPYVVAASYNGAVGFKIPASFPLIVQFICHSTPVHSAQNAPVYERPHR
uniref:Putative secreted protein n=1 Tax=Anopheles triannulatus TaxID=58253 RepID=A0A2M4B4S4_9DIPT